jgi:hypothetical protein
MSLRSLRAVLSNLLSPDLSARLPSGSKTRQARPLLWVGLLVLGGLSRPILLSTADTNVELTLPKTQTQALAAARSQQRRQQEAQVRSENYDLQRHPFTDAKADHWKNLLWTTAVTEPRQPFVLRTLEQLLAKTAQPTPAGQSSWSNAQLRNLDMVMQVSTQLYLADPKSHGGLEAQFRQTIDRSMDVRWVATALSALVASPTLSEADLQQLRDRLQKRFSGWRSQPSLYTSLRDLEQRLNPAPTPPLEALLDWQVATGQMQGYVICSNNRRVLCQMLLKDTQGNFLRENGKLWSVPLLLRSIHNLGWNFVRGNTPQGIYRIDGTTPQPDDEFFRAYGQFSLLNLYVPFEAGTPTYWPDRPGTFTGSLAEYQTLLPPRWRNHWGLQQTYWSGKIGRSLFRIHGSGDAPDFFRGKDDFPDSYNWNPTIGCLSALEIYSDTGKLLRSDMPKILKAIDRASAGSFQGYLVVVDLPQTRAVKVEEVVGAIDRFREKGGVGSGE